MRHIFRDKRGNTTVEFAIVLPILLFGTLLVFDLGRLLLAQSSIQESASETARMASLNPASSDIQITAYSRARVAGIDANNMMVDVVWQSGRQRGGNVSVTLTSDFELYSIRIFAVMPIQISASASLTIL